MIPLQNKPLIDWNISKKIFVKQHVLTAQQCQTICEWGSLNVKPTVNKYQRHFQTQYQACLLPHDHWVIEILQSLWDEAKNYYKFNLEFVEPYELKKYSAGDFFDRHTDNYPGLEIELDRKLTMTLQLSDPNDYQSGSLKVFQHSQPKTQGTAIIYPSFFSHQVEKIQSGTRWAMMSWAWGPYWQ
jgi:predicted 2-oxoglutarate/Fe(II)-dependent dioxygenase YbiX